MSRDDDWDDGLYGLEEEEDIEQAKRVRAGKYKVNKKRFAYVLAVFALIIAGCICVIVLVSNAISKGAAPVSSQIATMTAPDNTAPQDSTASVFPTPEKQISNASDALKGKSIILDAGHGGSDEGATGVNGTKEDELNLKVATKLKAALESMGAQIIMTRSDSNAIAETKEADMTKRKQIIKDNKTDIAISIHMNSVENDASVSGPLTLFMLGSEKGKSLAEAIIKELNNTLHPAKEGTARGEGNLLILKSGYQPTVIVECGYLSNAEEETKLKQDDYQDQIVQAICAGVQAFFATPSAS